MVGGAVIEFLREAKRGIVSSSETPPADALGRYPNITKLIEKSGHITVGNIAPIVGAAVAADEHVLLATLLRRADESVDALLTRLDDAIGEALNDGKRTNEIEGGYFILANQANIARE